jgi:tripartite-type tricarboxylate transporter receptor subunit TctC
MVSSTFLWLEFAVISPNRTQYADWGESNDVHNISWKRCARFHLHARVGRIPSRSGAAHSRRTGLSEPDRENRIPLPPGGADIYARIVADKLSAKWGQPFIVEHKPGSGANIGAQFVAQSEPDGYTLLITPPGPLVISQHFYSKLAFDPTAFVPITVVVTQPAVLIANPKLPVSNLRELIAYARENPGKLKYASGGISSPPHLNGLMLTGAAGVTATHVPYRGVVQGMTDLVAGHVDMMFDNLSNALPQVREGRVKALGVTSKTRIPELPDVPAIAETYPDVLYTSWFGMVAPPKTPAAVVNKLTAAVAEAMRAPDVINRYKSLSATPGGSMSPTEMAGFLAEESARWRKLIIANKLKPE